MLLLTTPAHAQQRDFDCVDFVSQRDAQRLYDSIPGENDPYLLDRDGDGFACEVGLPSREQTAAYVMLAAALAGAMISGAYFWDRRRRAQAVKGHDLEDRLAELQSNLRTVTTSIEGIDKEVSARKEAVEQLKKEAQQAEELSRLSANQAEAVKASLRDVISAYDRRTLQINILLAIVTSIVGIGGSVLVSIFVP